MPLTGAGISLTKRWSPVGSEPRRRVAALVLATLVAALLGAATDRSAWHSTQVVHGLLEAVAVLLALTVGALSLVRYYSRKERLFLFLGTAFLGTALLDGYHVAVTLPAAIGRPGYEPAALAALTSWSWLASRSFLGICLLRLGFVRRSTRPWREPEPSLKEEIIVYAAIAVLVSACVMFVALAPLPSTLAPMPVVPRPLELAPAAFFLGAFWLHMRPGNWRQNAFEFWLVLAILAGAGAHLFMMRSAGLYDAWFDAAHVLKIVNYACITVGLLMSVYFTYRGMEHSRRALASTNEALQREEEALRHAKAVAEAANSAKSAFLASMSHELRTPLNSVIGFTKILLKNRSGTIQEKDLTYLDRIAANGEHLLGLINDLLDLSKIEARKIDLEVEETQLDKLIRETVDQLSGRREQGVELVTRLPEYVGPMQTDPKRLRQVLINLVGNALKFTPEGSVTVALRVDADTGTPLALNVIDTGIGIASDRMRRIFEPFEQADSSTTRRYGGTGLGLSISRELCRMLGYRIEASSELGSGSTFTIVFHDTSLPQDGIDPD